MLKPSEIDELEILIGQLDGLHSEISALAKKSPNDAVNEFKLKFVNAVLNQANSFLGEKYRPFNDFEYFDKDDVPSNSDTTFILTQYMQALEKFRSDNIYAKYNNWYYRTADEENKIPTSPPRKLSRK